MKIVIDHLKWFDLIIVRYYVHSSLKVISLDILQISGNLVLFCFFDSKLKKEIS